MIAILFNLILCIQIIIISCATESKWLNILSQQIMEDLETYQIIFLLLKP